MNKKATISLTVEKIVILIIALTVLLIILVSVKGKLSNLVEIFINFMREIFKY